MNIKSTFNSFSAKNLDDIKQFYGECLGFEVSEVPDMGMKIKLPDGHEIFAYPKDNHEPATYTILNIVVDDIDKAVDEMSAKGVEFEKYEGFNQDEKGIARSTSPEQGPSIAWFKDPADNILAVLE